MKYSWRDLVRGFLEVSTATLFSIAATMQFVTIPQLQGFRVLLAALLGVACAVVAVYALLQIGAAGRDRDAAKRDRNTAPFRTFEP